MKCGCAYRLAPNTDNPTRNAGRESGSPPFQVQVTVNDGRNVFKAMARAYALLLAAFVPLGVCVVCNIQILA